MRRLTILLVGAMLAVGGCGGDDEASSSGSSAATSTPTPTEAASSGGENIAIAAEPSELKFDKTELTAKAGKVTITMDNPSDIPHAVEIEGNGVDAAGETVGKGEKSIATADLKAGSYDFFCPVGNHRAAGMEGKLTVE